jgi:hypothetical protein
MKQRTILIFSAVIVLSLLSAIAVLLYIRKSTNSNDVLPRGTSREFSFSDVQSHATAVDCWVSYGAQVFDITQFVAASQQVQSVELIKLCGTNLDTLPASIKTTEKLSQYQIGILTP